MDLSLNLSAFKFIEFFLLKIRWFFSDNSILRNCASELSAELYLLLLPKNLFKNENNLLLFEFCLRFLLLF